MTQAGPRSRDVGAELQPPQTLGRPLTAARRNDYCARRGEHAADAVADRDLGVGDLGGGGAAHLAHALL